jgi:hypothetical protein
MAGTLRELFICPIGSTGEDIVLYDQLCERLQRKARAAGLDALSDPARVILLADRYDAGMFRSGWYTLMSLDDYDLMGMIPALEAIGARVTAQVLRELASLFPSGTIPMSVPVRDREYKEHVMGLEDQLNDLEARLNAVELKIERVPALAERFALAHRAELAEEEA